MLTHLITLFGEKYRGRREIKWLKMNSPRRKLSFYIYLKSSIHLYQIDAGWFDEDGAGWSFAQSQAGELWQAVFSWAGSVREGCSALGAFNARLGCFLMGGVSVVLVANPSANHTLWGRSLSLSSFYTWGSWGTGGYSHYGRVPVTELSLCVPNANPSVQATWLFSLTSVFRDHDGKRY